MLTFEAVDLAAIPAHLRASKIEMLVEKPAKNGRPKDTEFAPFKFKMALTSASRFIFDASLFRPPLLVAAPSSESLRNRRGRGRFSRLAGPCQRG